jgi:hypothetical protein
VSAEAAHAPANRYDERPALAGSMASGPTPYLFDCLPGRMAADAWAIVDLIRSGGGEGCDIRLMVDDGEPWLDALEEVADILRCDVYVSPPGAVLASRRGDVMAVDIATNAPKDWLVVRPRDVPVHHPTWFERRGGRLAARDGLVALPISGGLAFATRRSFFDVAAICHDVLDAQPGRVTTVACATRSGQFEIGWYHGPEAVLSGSDFARLITASIDELHSDVKLALDWPEDPVERSAVEANVRQFAEALARTVWVRSQQSPAPAGRGVPGEPEWVRMSAEAATPAPNWPPEHQRALRHADEAFRALRFDHPDEAAALRQATAVWSEYVPAFELWLRDGPQACAETDQLVELRRQLMAVPAHELSSSSADETHALGSRPVGPAPFEPVGPVGPAPFAPAGSLGSPKRRPHGIDWLPPRPRTNTSPIELFVWSSFEPMQLAGSGLPTSDVFLLASSDLVRMCRSHRTGHVLRLMVAPGGAVELSTYAATVPARMQHRVRQSWSTHVVPLVWLPDVIVREVCYLDGRAEPEETKPWPGGSLPVRFVGAAHGVPGLPNEVVRWPARRQHARAHITLPYDQNTILARMQAYPGWLPLYCDTPHVPTGHYLLDLDISHRGVIDLPATLAALEGVPVAAPSLWGFNGVELVLPARDFARTSVIKVHATGPRALHLHAGLRDGQTLSDMLPQAIAEAAAWVSDGSD